MNESSRMSFLGAGLQRLRDATVTVLGAGGGGSHIAQQIAHLAVGTLAVVDPDELEASNVNRVVCARYADVGRAKSELLAERLEGLGGSVVPVVARAESPRGRYWMERSDVVLGAVDGARSRRNIEQICRKALVPYVDIGLRIDVGTDGAVRGIGGQVFVSVPGGPCMRCAEIVADADLARDREEYVAGAPEQQVVSMNGLLASQAVNAALLLIADYAPAFALPALVRYDGLLHQMKPERAVSGPCPHHPIAEAGWKDVLPPRIGAAG